MTKTNGRYFSNFIFYGHLTSNKTEVESVQLGNTYIAGMDKCCLDRCRGDGCYMLYMFPGSFV